MKESTGMVPKMPETITHPEVADKIRPRRVTLGRDVVERFVPTPKWRECEVFKRGNLGHERMGHSDACRSRLGKNVAEDESFKSNLSKTEERMNRYLAEYVEKLASKKRHVEESEVPQPTHEVPQSTDPQPGGSSTSPPKIPKSAAVPQTFDDSGIPSATPEVAMGKPRKSEGDGGDEDRGEVLRPRLEAILQEDTKFDMCEMFSVPRVCRWAGKYELSSGYSVDSAALDPITQRKRDFTATRDRGMFMKLLSDHPPLLLVVSPPRTVFSQLQAMRGSPVPQEDWDKGMVLLE